MDTRQTINVNPIQFAAALKAIRKFTSEDPTREPLHRIRAEVKSGKLRLIATDGHTLCAVTINAATSCDGRCSLNQQTVDALMLQAKHAKGQTDVSIELEHDDKYSFPDWGRAVPPPAENGSKGVTIHGFDALYLARIGHVQKTLKARLARIQVGDTALEPLRADIDGDIGTAVVVVMPVKL